jgi:hypothetical protein
MAKPYVPKIARRWVTVGVVVRPFGIRGELKVRSETDFPEARFQPGARLYWWLPPQPEPDDAEPASTRKRPPRTRRPKRASSKAPAGTASISSSNWKASTRATKPKPCAAHGS